MYLNRLLQINIVTMAALGTLLLGMGQRNPALPLWMLTAGVASLWLTDLTGWFRLNRTVTNLAALAAFAVFLWQVSELRGLVRILAIGNLLVYLQIILLFQEKEPRTYWQLALLSLLQVVVAAAFRQKALFGLLLVAYLFVGLSALVLLFLHRERGRHRPAASLLPPRSGAGRRWPLAGQESAFTDAIGGYAGQAGIGRELRRRVVGMGFGTLVLTLMVFFVLPRWGRDPWRGPRPGATHAVGFSEQVTLGELGSILENPEEVLRIQFFDYASDEPYRVFGGELYLRGALLTDYRGGEWTCENSDASDFIMPLGVTPVVTTAHLVRQKILIEPMDHETLFCVWPYANLRDDQRLYVNPARQILFRPHSHMTSRFAYELATSGFHENVQIPAFPASHREQAGLESLLGSADGARDYPGLVALARAWVEDSKLEPDDHYACARLLERRLRDSGEFEYSLEGQSRNPALDPIEDFITENRRGHCEYFATALVLMLRNRGIPARMVVGYKTDEWNELGSFFQVRQFHAHTWVEAYLAPRHADDEPELAELPLRAPHGVWLRLEPTPPGGVTRINPLVDMFGKSFDWLNFLWANYIMEMDQPRQHRVVYDPLAEALRHALARLTDLDWWRTLFDALAAALGTGLRNLILLLAALVLGVGLLVAYHLLRAGLDRWWPRLAGRAAPGARGARAQIEFYRRLEAVLARFGMLRSASQTQRDFARRAGRRVAQSTGQSDLAALPEEVVEAFYRVRFGGAPLDNVQAHAVEQAIRQLKQAAGSGPSAPS